MFSLGFAPQPHPHPLPQTDTGESHRIQAPRLWLHLSRFGKPVISLSHLLERKPEGQALPQPAARRPRPPPGPAVPLERHHWPQHSRTCSAPLPTRHRGATAPSLAWWLRREGPREQGTERVFIPCTESGGGYGLLNPNKSERPREGEATGDSFAELHTDPRRSSQRSDVLLRGLLESRSAFLLTNEKRPECNHSSENRPEVAVARAAVILLHKKTI